MKIADRTSSPGPLREPVGANYNEFSNLAAGLSLKSAQDNFTIPADARATGWVDGLQLEGATPLAYYEHPHFGRFLAIVSQPFGKGRVTYCGTLPDQAFSKTLARWVLAQAGITFPFADHRSGFVSHRQIGTKTSFLHQLVMGWAACPGNVWRF